jgi:hypothetical protein
VSYTKFTTPIVAYIVRLENKNIFIYFENALFCNNAGIVVVNSEVVGLGPGQNFCNSHLFAGNVADNAASVGGL